MVRPQPTFLTRPNPGNSPHTLASSQPPLDRSGSQWSLPVIRINDGMVMSQREDSFIKMERLGETQVQSSGWENPEVNFGCLISFRY